MASERLKVAIPLFQPPDDLKHHLPAGTETDEEGDEPSHEQVAEREDEVVVEDQMRPPP